MPRLSAPRRSLRLIAGEGGFALPLALSIMFVIGALVMATIGFATHNTDRSIRDRKAARALAAADAGVEAALYRMNKALVSTQLQGLLGVVPGLLAEVKCVSLSLGQLTLLNPSNGWCPEASSSEVIDGPATSGETWVDERFTYQVSMGLEIDLIPTQNAKVIERKIIATGYNGNVKQRVMATAEAWIGNSGTVLGDLLKLFEQTGYVKCTPEPPNPADPTSGCA